MNEQLSIETPNSVWWINAHEGLGRRERFIKWWRESVTNGSTYIPKEQIPFSTSIPAEEIPELVDPNLRATLLEQVENIRNNDSGITVPVATHITREFKLAWVIPTQPMISLDH